MTLIQSHAICRVLLDEELGVRATGMSGQANPSLPPYLIHHIHHHTLLDRIDRSWVQFRVILSEALAG